MTLWSVHKISPLTNMAISSLFTPPQKLWENSNFGMELILFSFKQKVWVWGQKSTYTACLIKLSSAIWMEPWQKLMFEGSIITWKAITTCTMATKRSYDRSSTTAIRLSGLPWDRSLCTSFPKNISKNMWDRKVHFSQNRSSFSPP